ncbi:MAG: orotate phosphoribosyltransferase [Cyclobacteriaceae bacterium]|nr:orotate phosphoribosyltransferase [Cyclobacteriaceae bacterium]
MKTELEVAGMLLKAGAVKLNAKQPFTWASGWKSPIYCDNRLTLSFPEIRSFIKNQLCQTIRNKFPQVQAIAGVATAGIPQGALVADSMELPFLYVRSKPKGHGMENLIEGKITTGQKVVVIEDLVSTGGSSLQAIHALRNAGFEVLGMIAIFSYGFDVADENFTKAQVTLQVLSDYNALLNKAIELNYIKKEDLGLLQSWRNAPQSWQTN